MTAALDGGQFDLPEIYAWMNAGQISFTVSGAQSGTDDSNVDAVLVPMVPGLELTYDGATTTFGDADPPAAYEQVLVEYFAKLSLVGDGGIPPPSLAAIAEAVSPSASWFPA